MKFRLFSDLHLEFGNFNRWPRDSNDTVLLLSGDIGVGLMARNMIQSMCNHYRAVVMVCGNHEYYDQNIDEINKRFEDMAASIENFYFLNNASVQIDDVKIIGGTMWTDLSKGDWFTLQRVRNTMNDFEYIKFYEGTDEVRLTTTKVRNMFNEFRLFLEAELASGYTGKSIVMTHHAPCVLSISDDYRGDLLNAAYYEDMTKYMFEDNAPQFWVHGHIHESVNYTVGNTTVRSNPHGYMPKDVNPKFNVNFQFEL